MGAASVTGVGLGSVEGKNTGSKTYTVNADRVLGPRIVACGGATLASGAATVVLPLIGGDVTEYAVMVTTNGGTAAAVSATLTIDTVAQSTTISLHGTGTNNVWWAIVKQGMALLNLS
jgi:hypothetical protein